LEIDIGAQQAQFATGARDRDDHRPEQDQGIGGRIGAVVGEKLWRLARRHQVLCVTHLPQLAAYADQHFKVEKAVGDGRTTTKIVDLKDEPRLLELANMLGDVSEGTLQSANELLNAVQDSTASV
jgi:DNA repair protein RecN (Recombination protein N)